MLNAKRIVGFVIMCVLLLTSLRTTTTLINN